MAHDTSRDVANTLRSLSDEAKRDGWKKTRVGWVCPGCDAYMKEHGITPPDQATAKAAHDAGKN